MYKRGRLNLMACSSGYDLAERIRDELKTLFIKDDGERNGFELADSREIYFANKEMKTVIDKNVRGDDMYILQCMDDPLSDRSPNDNIMALLTAIDAAHQSDVEQVTIIIPQFPYSRQEQRKKRECITAKLMAQIFDTFGVKRVITMDVHADAIAGFFYRTKFENLHASRLFLYYLTKVIRLENLVVVAPDVGSAERARFYSKALKSDLAIIDKARNYSLPSIIESMRLVGDVNGKNVFICDDLIATGGTIINACKLLKENGAKDIYIFCTHPFFNNYAYERFDRAYEEGIFNKIVGTDCVFWGKQFRKDHQWYEEVSVAELFAKVIYNINCKLSVSELLL